MSNRVHILMREKRFGKYIVGFEVVDVFASLKAANAEAKRRNDSPQGFYKFAVKTKQLKEVA